MSNFLPLIAILFLKRLKTLTRSMYSCGLYLPLYRTQVDDYTDDIRRIIFVNTIKQSLRYTISVGTDFRSY